MIAEGIPYSVTKCAAASEPTSTPSTALRTKTAVSQTFIPAFTSPIKSEYPGVSKMLIFVFFQSRCIREREIENWRSISFAE